MKINSVFYVTNQKKKEGLVTLKVIFASTVKKQNQRLLVNLSPHFLKVQFSFKCL